MGTSNRRNFIRNSTVAGIGIAAAGFSPRRIFSQEKEGSTKLVYRELGSTGFKTTEIGFGAMNMRDADLVRAAIDSGINYIDTAHSYMNGVNEEVVGSVMKTQRDKVFLTSKIKWNEPKRMPEMIGTSLKRLQTDHVDLLLLHVTDKREQILREDLMKIFDDARRKGQTRFIGVSSHSGQAEVLDAAVDSKLWEAVLVGYSYTSPPEVKQSIAKARKAGLAIIAMKSLLRGKGYSDHNMGDITPNQAALKWVLEDENVDTVIPGMTSFEQLAEDLPVMGMKLSIDDRRLLHLFSENLKGNYCSGVSGCTGCRNKCPKGVDVNEINRCLGYAYGYNDMRLALENYSNLPESKRLEVCSDCDECVVKCVNGLNLTENLRSAKKLFT